MVDKLLNQSPVAARVLTSQNEQARRHFTSARDLMAHARALSAGGQLRGADALLNEAIWEISKAQQLVPDPGTQQAGERARFAQLEDSVAALQRTALIALPQPSARQGDSSASGSRAAANVLVEQAVALARADRYIEANKQLDQALVLLLKDASTRLTGQTIVYDRRFADRREEFDFELERHPQLRAAGAARADRIPSRRRGAGAGGPLRRAGARAARERRGAARAGRHRGDQACRRRHRFAAARPAGGRA